jgi:hypothetical protein
VLGGELKGGYCVKPTVFKRHNKMRIFQEEIFGPVVSVTTFKTDEEALSIANDTLYGLGAGVWSRDANRCTASAVPSRPAACGPIAITPIPCMRRLVGTSSLASAARLNISQFDADGNNKK